MKLFLDDISIQDRINELLHLHKSFVLANMEEIDSEVENQKTRVYKFKCWFIWGHLIKKGKTSCSRCGKVIDIKS